MRRTAFRARSARALACAIAACWGALGGLGALNPPSAAAAGSVTVQTSYENTPISLDMSDAVGYGFTNTTGQTETVTFTDLLPYGAQVDTPAAVTDTAGTGACVLVSDTANPGTTTVSATVQVPSSTASGAVCTISVGIVPGVASSGDVALSDYYLAASVSPSTGVTFTKTTAGLVVLSNPTVTLSEPTNGQTFTLGQLFDASFSCATTDPLDSIDSFFATDDEGNQIVPGEPIDTVDPGHHTLEVDCYSAAGGGDVSASVGYTVSSYTLKAVSTTKTDHVSFKSTLPAGKLVAKVIDGTKLLGTTTDTLASAKTASVTVKPTTAGQKILTATKGTRVKVELEVSFTPAPIGSGDNEILPATSTVVTRSGLRLRLTKSKPDPKSKPKVKAKLAETTRK